VRKWSISARASTERAPRSRRSPSVSRRRAGLGLNWPRRRRERSRQRCGSKRSEIWPRASRDRGSHRHGDRARSRKHSSARDIRQPHTGPFPGRLTRRRRNGPPQNAPARPRKPCVPALRDSGAPQRKRRRERGRRRAGRLYFSIRYIAERVRTKRASPLTAGEAMIPSANLPSPTFLNSGEAATTWMPPFSLKK